MNVRVISSILSVPIKHYHPACSAYSRCSPSGTVMTQTIPELVHRLNILTPVIDADQETFEVITNRAISSRYLSDSQESHLGILNDREDRISVRLVVSPPKPLDLDITDASGLLGSTASRSTSITERRKRPSKGRARKDPQRLKDVEIEVDIKQDMKRLKGHAGGTGCVVWRTSLYFLEYLLPQLYFPSASSPHPPLFDTESLRQANVLELGSGTGLVAAFLAKFVRRWVCSDQLDCLKLISQNVSSLYPPNETNIEIAEVDWLHPTPPPAEAYDLILCLDCVYNPSVIKGLVQTFDSQSEKGRTVICIVMEVRAEDVVGDFLETWLQSGTSNGDKAHWAVNRFDWGDDDGAGGKFVGWLGWKGER